MSEYVFVTLVMLGDAYARGVGVLAHTLKKVGSKHPLWCMVTDDVSAETRLFLSAHVDRVVLVPTITKDSTPLRTAKQREIYGGWISSSYTKWNAINPLVLPGVKKCVFLDADAIVRENIDSIFDLPGPAGVFATPWAQPYCKRNSAGKNPYLDRAGKPPKHGQLITKQQLRAGLTSAFVADASLVLLYPDQTAFQLITRLLSGRGEYGFSGCFSGNDEQLLGDLMLQSTSGPYARVYNIHSSWSCNMGHEKAFAQGQPVRVSQYYNSKPWDGVSTREELARVLAEAKYDDIAEWWRLTDVLLAEDPMAESIYFPGDAAKVGGAGADHGELTTEAERADSIRAYLDSL
jgi:hypothetical protein